MIFHSQDTAHVAEQVNRAVRQRHPSHEDVVVASVIDLSLVPPIYWLTASMMIGQAHERASREVPPGIDPSDYILLLQDWGGLLSRKFGVRAVNREAAVVVIDENANISCFYQGREPVEAVLGALEE